MLNRDFHKYTYTINRYKITKISCDFLVTQYSIQNDVRLEGGFYFPTRNTHYIEGQADYYSHVLEREGNQSASVIEYDFTIYPRKLFNI